MGVQVFNAASECVAVEKGNGTRTAESHFTSEPEPQAYNMNLELINQVLRPERNTVGPAFTDGQVVWRKHAVWEKEGFYMAYDLNPYII